MAGYRPKSLEELNSLYDKSINIKNEIDKKASDLEVKQVIYTPAASAEKAAYQEAAAETAAEEISGIVDARTATKEELGLLMTKHGGEIDEQ